MPRCCRVSASPCSPLGEDTGTLNDVHTACQSNELARQAYATGFVSGVAFMANYVSKGTLERQALWPKKTGDLVDAVCRYIDLHPELWAEEATLGVLDAVNALYLPPATKRRKE